MHLRSGRWPFKIYNVYTLPCRIKVIFTLFCFEGGFRAHVTVRGVDFECSSGGDMCSNPREARELAAAQMLAKLRTMTSSTQ